MTVPVQTPEIAYTGNGVTTSFAYGFKVLAAGDLVVRINGTLCVLNVDYTVTGVGVEAGGTVVFSVAPANSSAVTIQRSVLVNRLTDYQYQGDFLSPTVNRDFDRSVMMIQDIKVGVATSLRFPVGDTASGFLPNAATRALKGIAFDAAGNITVTAGSDSTSLASALQSNVSASVGAALVGFDAARAYVAGTTGAALKTAAADAAAAQSSATTAASTAATAQSTVDTFKTDVADSVNVAKGTALVGYKINATGAAGRTLQAKLGERISVKDFGAVGDGVADDTAAFQAAIDYVANLAIGSARGGRLCVPPGDYAITATLIMPASKPMELFGEGSGTKLFRKTGTGNIIECRSGSTISGLFFKGPASASSNGIFCNGANVARIENCWFENQNNGIELSVSYAVEIVSCVFDVCYTYGIVAATSAHNTVIERCNFYTAGVRDGGQAIRFSVASDNISIENNDFEYCNVNIQLTSCASVRITGNYLEYHKAACFSFTGCGGVIIESNWIALGQAGTGGDVCTIANITGGRFVSNTIYNQTVAFTSGALTGFTVGLNKKSGTGTLGGAPWIAPVLLNGWTQQANYSTAGFIKDENGWVQLRGGFLSGTVPNAIFTLDVGYRPASIAVFGTASANGDCRITVGTDGTVTPNVAAANNPMIDGIRFYVG